jgi:hypothetical protein
MIFWRFGIISKIVFYKKYSKESVQKTKSEIQYTLGIFQNKSLIIN